MADYQISSADQIAPAQLKRFLDRVYPARKSQFLDQHGEWWHHANSNRWITITDSEEVVAYCAIIPITCQISGTRREALWWIDLIVLPEYRGKGLQHDLDQKVREAADLKLGFPNSLAAKIHRKHGWNVSDRIRIMMLPLRPTKVRQVREAAGLQGVLLKTLAGVASPLAALARWRFALYDPGAACRIEARQAGALADVFMRYNAGMPLITAYRDAAYIQWRYLDSPYRDELRFYAAGPPDKPTQVLITRMMDCGDERFVRILDVFGDLDDAAGLGDLLRLVRRDAVREGADRVMVLASHPAWQQALRRAGFAISVRGLFCWLAQSDEVMWAVERGTYHWNYADSDNDESCV